ncbi:unnamed protein product [Cochlearia groenlandica]
MESTRVIMMMMMVIVMVIGNLVNETKAQDSTFRDCYPVCLLGCVIEKKFPSALMCPLTCIMTCLSPPTPIPSPPSQMILSNEINHFDYFCKLGCATHHCVPLSTLQNPNVEKVADCVDSCSDRCSTKF